jgi:hypothetical protein
MKKIYLFLLLIGFIPTYLTAQYITAEDDASNYTTWTNGSNEGFGFGAWDLWLENSGGHFIASSDGDGFGNIDVDSKSFGMWGNPSSNVAHAQRLFSEWSDGATFSVDIATAYRNGFKGIDLWAVEFDKIWTFNVGSDKYTAGGADQSWAYSQTSIFKLSVTQNGADISISLIRGTDNYSTTISNKTLIGFKFYISSDGNQTLDNLYFNNLKIEYSDPSKVPATANVKINGNVDLAADESLTVNDLTVDGSNTLTIKSTSSGTGSLIVNGTVSGNVTVERYIPTPSGTGGSWNDNYGWRLLSAPVTGQSISDFTVTPASNYDFYLWHEDSDLWYNYKAGDWNTYNTDNTGTSQSGDFALGRGYMVAYASEQTGFSFTGELTTGNVTWTNLSYSGDGNGEVYSKGWHLLGNPFTSALKWNVGSWNLSNVSTTAKIWNEASRSFVDITSDGANKYIPAGQGFLIQVSGAANSITIPEDARDHQGATWFKNSTFNGILLVARENQDTYGQENNIIISDGSSHEFNFEHDSRFFAGYAPQFYSVFGEEKVSTKKLPNISEEMVIPFDFIKNNATEFAIELKESTVAYPIFLTDNKTGTIHKLSENPVYSFTASEGDSPNRFLLHFGVVGIGEQEQAPTLQAYVVDNRLYVNNSMEQAQLAVYDLQGRLVAEQSLNTAGLQALPLELPAGMYIVRLNNASESRAVKINVQ